MEGRHYLPHLVETPRRADELTNQYVSMDLEAEWAERGHWYDFSIHRDFLELFQTPAWMLESISK